MQLVSWIAKQTGKISDRFNDYKFYVKQEPEVIDSSSTLCIQTFDSRDMTATIPCSFRWFTVRNGLTTEIHQFKGNTYICQPIDVGCQLQVEITSSDPQCTGTAILTYGPVKFDILLKKQIQMALATGDAMFIVDIGENNFSRQCHLRVEEQKIQIRHIPTQLVFTFDYNLIQPKVQIFHKIPTKARINFNPKYYESLQQFLSRLFNRQVHHDQIARNPFLEINLNNRKVRDALIFIIKAFNTKKYLKNTTYVSNLQKQMDFTKISQKDYQKTIDYLQEISELDYDINKLIEMYGKVCMEKRFYLEESNRLQKEFQEAIGTYIKIIEEKFKDKEDFEKSFVVLKEKEEEFKMQKAQKHSKDLNDMESLEDKVSMLEQENSQLKKSLQAYQNNSVNNSNSSNNSPFKRKNIFEPVSPSSNSFIQTPGFDQANVRPFDESELKKQIHDITVKYETAMREIEQLKSQKMTLVKNEQKINDESIHLDGFDAKSVKSLSDHNQINRSPSNVSSSLLLSNPNHTVNPERLLFTSPQKQSIKPLSPSYSLQSYPIVSQLQQQNLALKHQVAMLLEKIQSLISQNSKKQQKYKKRISQLTQQIQIYKRNNDVLNRSQHLSMQMEDYNESQLKTLKEQNDFLKKEIETCQRQCLKYKTELKKYRIDNTMSEKSMVLNQVGA